MALGAFHRQAPDNLGAAPQDARPAVRVLLVSPLPPPRGGTGTWTELLLAAAGARPGIDVEVVDTSPRWRAEHDLALWKRLVGGGLQGLRDLARTVTLLATRRPDVLHLCSVGQLAVMRDAAICAAAWMTGTPLVYHLHFGRIPGIAARSTCEWAVMSRVIRQSACTVVLDERTRLAVENHLPTSHVRLVPNCFDPAEFVRHANVAPAARELPRVLYLGWVLPTKGMAELFVAATRVWCHVRFELRIVGPVADEYREELLGSLSPANRSQVHFTGPVARCQALDELAAADLLALPSHTEGFPNVVLEALALGKPVVATEVGAIPQMLAGVDGPCGLCVPPRDEEAFARALRTLLTDPAMRRLMGESGRITALERYTVAAVFRSIEEMWRAAADGRLESISA